MPADDSMLNPVLDDEKARANALMRDLGGPNVSWGAQSALDLIVAERRFRAEQSASNRIERATWILSVSTVVLALATIGLIIATIAD